MRFIRIRGHHFLSSPLVADSVVVDAGAHLGEFSAEIIHRFGSHCHLIEAHPHLAESLHLPEAASLTHGALGCRDGHVVFHLRSNLEAGSIGHTEESEEGTEIEMLSLPTYMSRIGISSIDLLKMDIEGAEFDLLLSAKDEVLKKISQISVEFHDFLAQYAERGLFEQVRKRLEGLGFLCCVMAFRTHGDVVFINRARIRMSWLEAFYAMYLARWVLRIKKSIQAD